MVIGKRETQMTKFQTIVEALNRNAKVVVGLNSYKGSADVAKFASKYEAEDDLLHYAQTRIFETGVKYTTHFRAAH